MNKLHERALRLMYDVYTSTFEELLEKDQSFTVHHCNVQTLCKDLFKVYNNLYQTIFSNLFIRNLLVIRCVYNRILLFRKLKVFTKALTHFGPIIWNLIPNKIKYSDSLMEFL